MRTGELINDIQAVIADCEYIQSDNESDYTKEKAKISAYDEIADIVARFVKWGDDR